MYADYLEQTGRLNEALSMRREVIRLYKSFNHFTKLPIQLARLALLLERMGDLVGSKEAADEARALLVEGRLPKGRSKLTMEFLAKLGKKVETNDEDRKALVDLQPERSIVIPIEGAPWTTMFTIANPSGIAQEGTLRCKGLPMKITREGERDDIAFRPKADAKDEDAALRLRLEPQSYELVKIIADHKVALQGEVTLTWLSLDGNSHTEAKVQIEAPEKGIKSSIIQAGNYRTNPFYGVPVYLHYVNAKKDKESSPMRFVTSQKARVEVYALNGAPLSVDDQGNGSLWDKGDELFVSGNQEGNLLLPLVDGAASFMILVYPVGALPEEGLTLKVEAYQDGKWVINSENKLMP
jgi:hypothetical protein